LNTFEEFLISNGIIDSHFNEFKISDWFDDIKLSYSNSKKTVNINFEGCYEINLKHDITYKKEVGIKNSFKYFIQDIEIHSVDEKFKISIKAWPLDAEILCNQIKITESSNNL